MAKSKTADENVLDPDTMKVESLDEFAERGWLYYSHQEYNKAISDFQHVLDQQADRVDTLYGLGLTFKATGSLNEAAETFDRILPMLDQVEDKQKAHVLERLVKGHINQIKTGDWDLEKEVWKRA